MLEAYRGVDFRPWLRGRIDGIPAEEMRRLLSARDLVRAGVLLHVVAQGALQRRYSAGGGNVRGALADAGFDKRLIERNVEKLHASRARPHAGPDARPNGPTTTGRTPTTPPSSTRRRPSCDAPWKPAAGGASGTWGATPAPSRGSPPRTPTRSSPWTPIRWPSSGSTSAFARRAVRPDPAPRRQPRGRLP